MPNGRKNTLIQIGNPEETMILQGPTQFVANAIQPVENPRRRGFGEKPQLCSLTICLDGSAPDAAAGAAAIDFTTEAEVHDFLDACLSSVRFFSSELGNFIMPQTLSQLVRTSQFSFGLYPDGIPALGDAKTVAANQWVFNVRIELRWAFPEYKSIGYAHAPFVGFMDNGGIALTMGDGQFITDVGGAAITWNLDATSTVTCRMRAEEGRPIAKVSPLVYGYRTVPGLQGNQYDAGHYYSFCQLTDNATTLASNVGNSGHRIFVDGELIQPFENEDPRTRYHAVANGWADRGAKIAGHFATLDANEPTGLNQNGAPIFSADIAGNASERLEVSNVLVVDSGANYTAASDFGYVFARPIDMIGEGKGACACGPAGSKVVLNLPNPLQGVNAAGEPKGAMVSPELIVTR